MHTVIVVDPAGVPIRVVCGFCQSEHNYRGGPEDRHGVGAGGCEPERTDESVRRAATASRFPSSANEKGLRLP